VALTDSAAPLSGVRVIEVGDRIATAYCGKLLRDAGAEVVLIEGSGGCELRRQHPAFFAYLAGGKRSLVIEDGEPLPMAELACADIVILGANPVQTARLGFDIAEFRSAAPHPTLVLVSDFGWAGPWSAYPATEFTLQAWCGSTGSRGDPEQVPIAVGGDLGEFLIGSYAAFFGLAGYYGRSAPEFDLSGLEAMTIAMQVFSWLRVELMGLAKVDRTIEVPSVERARDGYVGITMATAQQWRDFCSMVECDDLAEDPALRFQSGRWEQRNMIRARTAGWFASRTVAEIVQLAAARRIPMAAIGNGETIPAMDHLVQRGVYVEHPAGFQQPRTPWLMSESEPLSPAAPPGLGDYQPASRPPSAGVRSPDLPLAGLRVVDLTAFWAGPCATNLFGTLGADVIKIESAQHPDGMRLAGGYRPDVDWWEYSWVYHGVNTAKRSLTLDLGSDSGKCLFEKLVASADVVIENFTPRVLTNFGLDYPVLRDLKSNIIVVRMPGFGLDGPWRDRVGFAMTMEQIAGLAWITGHTDGLPTPPRGACDPLAGLHAAFATLAALEHRRRTGRGQLIEIPMIDVVLNASALQVIERQTSGKLLARNGNRGHRFAVQNLYACAGDDDWLALSVRDDRDWLALVDLLGNPPWACDARLRTEDGRQNDADAIDARLADWFAAKPLEDTVTRLLAAGIPAAAVVSPAAVTANPVHRARGFFENVQHPLCGPLPYPRPPVMPLCGHSRFITRPAPLLGQHNLEILCGEMGLTEEQVSVLLTQGVIGHRPRGV
jgi:crotonobetainyl-CoA:carnitine CoA-transferase CaiB-like acyl-CoA transferase